MVINSFNQKITIICLFLGLGVVSLSLLLIQSGPRIRYIQSLGDISETRLSQNATIQLVFDRPIEKTDYSDSIQITPNVDFIAQTNTQNIALTFKENLNHNTEYTITVSPTISDTSGKQMRSPYSHSFTTAEASYIYLERNYSSTTPDDADDHIKLAAVGSEPQILLSHPEIRSFSANRTYAVVATIEDETDTLYTINLETNEVRREQLFSNGRINNLTLSARGNIVLYTIEPNFNEVSLEYFERIANRIQSVNLITGEVVNLTTDDGSFIKASSITFDTDGQVALIQDLQQTFYAVSPFNDYNPVLIGSYAESFGFNSDLSEIIFRDRESFIRYSIATSDIVPAEFDKKNGYIQDITDQNGEIFYSDSSLFSGISITDIYKKSDWQSPAEETWNQNSSQTGSRIRNFTPSYDNSLLALLQNPDDCQFDSVLYNRSCKTAYFELVDLESDEIIQSFKGSNLIWLP